MMSKGQNLGDQMLGAVRGYLERAFKPLMERLDAMDARILAIPQGRDGKDADPESIRAAADAAIQEAMPRIYNSAAKVISAELAKIPPAKDGRDGRDADMESIRQFIRDEVAALPRPRDGVDGKPGRDGVSVHPDTIALMVKEEIAKLPPAKQGEPGRDGRDAAELVILPAIDKARSYPAGTWAKHAGGLIRAQRQTDAVSADDVTAAGWDVVLDGLSAMLVVPGEDERTFQVSAMLTSGVTATSSFTVPVMMYLGIWKEAQYQRGDVVTFDGSMWHCKSENTLGRPGQSPDWQLCVRRGAAGKDAKGLPERDAKQAVSLK